MGYYVIGALILALMGSLSHAQTTTSVGMEDQCDQYCFKVLRPMLDHISAMQKFWVACDTDQMANTQPRLDKIEGQMAAQLEKAASHETAIEDIKQNLMKQGNLVDKCKKGPFKQIGSKYYYIEQTLKANWFAAAHRCHEFGAHLISLANQKELDAIIPHLTLGQIYWTDNNDLSNEGVFLSLTSGQRPPFQNWDPNEPNNNGEEHCVYLHGSEFRMNDFKCSHDFYFICESSNE